IRRKTSDTVTVSYLNWATISNAILDFHCDVSLRPECNRNLFGIWRPVGVIGIGTGIDKWLNRLIECDQRVTCLVVDEIKMKIVVAKISFAVGRYLIATVWGRSPNNRIILVRSVFAIGRCEHH